MPVPETHLPRDAALAGAAGPARGRDVTASPFRSAPEWPLLAGLASAAMLAGAHAFEHFGGMAPCALCLHQREAHWVTLGVGLAGWLLLMVRPGREGAAAISMLLGAGFLAGSVIAGFHAGVELKWWPGLPSCAGGTGTIDFETFAQTLNQPVSGARCDEIPWSLGGISMAGWNMLVSLALGAISLRAAFTGGRILTRPSQEGRS